MLRPDGIDIASKGISKFSPSTDSAVDPVPSLTVGQMRAARQLQIDRVRPGRARIYSENPYQHTRLKKIPRANSVARRAQCNRAAEKSYK